MGELHPAIVHLPIGILTLYSLSEFLRFGPFRGESWTFTKLFLLVTGTLGAFIGSSSGEALEDLVINDQRLLDLHERFANLSTWVYSIMAVVYLVWYVEKRYGAVNRLLLWHIVSRISAYLRKPPVAMIAGAIGFLMLTLTGIFGGAMVHGPDVDPLVTETLKLFGAY